MFSAFHMSWTSLPLSSQDLWQSVGWRGEDGRPPLWISQLLKCLSEVRSAKQCSFHLLQNFTDELLRLDIQRSQYWCKKWGKIHKWNSDWHDETCKRVSVSQKLNKEGYDQLFVHCAEQCLTQKPKKKERMSDLFARTFGEVSWCWPKDEQVGSWLASHTLYGNSTAWIHASTMDNLYIWCGSGDPEDQLWDWAADQEGQTWDETEL